LKKYLENRIYLDEEKTKWCKVLVFKERYDMQKYYLRHDKKKFDKDHFHTEGVHMAGVLYRVEEDGSTFLHGETGVVLLHFDQCGAGIISHEFGHAVLWAYNFSIEKEQYPLVINSMEEEEIILHDLYRAVSSFYQWYWKAVDPYFNRKSSK
jgi:hypothetical protein